MEESAASIGYPENGDSWFLRNIGTHQQNGMV
jgi:hypothetical protein